MNTLLIKGGRVVDPKNGVDAVMDVFVKDGKVAAVGENRAQPNERAQRADPDRRGGPGQEVRRRNVQVIAARREVVPQLVTEENGEERQ